MFCECPAAMPLEMIRLDAVLAEVDHLGAAVDLLVAVGDGDRIELAAAVVAAQDAARILPGDGRAGLDLRPGDLGVVAAAVAALGDEVVNAALAVLVAGVPVLHGGVLDLGIVERDQLDDRGVQLVLVAHRRGAALQVGDIGTLVGDDERALELAGLLLVDAEVGGELHRTAHALRHVDERAVGEHRRVERGVEVVGLRHHRAQILAARAQDARVTRLRDRAEDDAGLCSSSSLKVVTTETLSNTASTATRDPCTPARISRSLSGMPSRA